MYVVITLVASKWAFLPEIDDSQRRLFIWSDITSRSTLNEMCETDQCNLPSNEVHIGPVHTRYSNIATLYISVLRVHKQTAKALERVLMCSVMYVRLYGHNLCNVCRSYVDI